MKTRLDAELVRRELARSREHAADLIESRSVLVAGIPATKARNAGRCRNLNHAFKVSVTILFLAVAINLAGALDVILWCCC